MFAPSKHTNLNFKRGKVSRIIYQGYEKLFKSLSPKSIEKVITISERSARKKPSEMLSLKILAAKNMNEINWHHKNCEKSKAFQCCPTPMWLFARWYATTHFAQYSIWCEWYACQFSRDVHCWNQRNVTNGSGSLAKRICLLEELFWNNFLCMFRL